MTTPKTVREELADALVRITHAWQAGEPFDAAAASSIASTALARHAAEPDDRDARVAEALERAAEVIDDMLAEHRKPYDADMGEYAGLPACGPGSRPGSDLWHCEDYGCGSLESIAAAIRALKPEASDA